MRSPFGNRHWNLTLEPVVDIESTNSHGLEQKTHVVAIWTVLNEVVHQVTNKRVSWRTGVMITKQLQNITFIPPSRFVRGKVTH